MYYYSYEIAIKLRIFSDLPSFIICYMNVSYKRVEYMLFYNATALLCIWLSHIANVM